MVHLRFHFINYLKLRRWENEQIRICLSRNFRTIHNNRMNRSFAWTKYGLICLGIALFGTDSLFFVFNEVSPVIEKTSKSIWSGATTNKERKELSIEHPTNKSSVQMVQLNSDLESEEMKKYKREKIEKMRKKLWALSTYKDSSDIKMANEIIYNEIKTLISTSPILSSTCHNRTMWVGRLLMGEDGRDGTYILKNNK